MASTGIFPEMGTKIAPILEYTISAIYYAHHKLTVESWNCILVEVVSVQYSC
jgi:hypothetical protein